MGTPSLLSFSGGLNLYSTSRADPSLLCRRGWQGLFSPVRGLVPTLLHIPPATASQTLLEAAPAQYHPRHLASESVTVDRGDGMGHSDSSLSGLPGTCHPRPPAPCSMCIKCWNQRGEGCCSRSLCEKRQKEETELSILAPSPGIFLAGSLPPACGPALTTCTSMPTHYSHQ